MDLRLDLFRRKAFVGADRSMNDLDSGRWTRFLVSYKFIVTGLPRDRVSVRAIGTEHISTGTRSSALEIGGLARLTQGEIACLEGVSKNLGSKQIARQLDISPHTVDARLKSACGKLGTKSRFVAAKLLADNRGAGRDVTVTSADPDLVYEFLGLLDSPLTAEKDSSAGEGDGSDDLASEQACAAQSKRDFASGRSWFEPTHPVAIFFGGENRFSLGRRLAIIAAISIASAIAFSALLNGLVGVSRMAASP